ncbi:cobalamin biosynthesis protein CobW, partial [bacterium]
WGGVLRSKGLFWLATRGDRAGLWSQAGLSARCEGAGSWGDGEDSPRQELVFIGCDMDEPGLRASLDAALLSEDESRMVASLSDPFGEW